MIREFKPRDAVDWCKVREENLIKINSKHYPKKIIRILLLKNKPRKVAGKYNKQIMLVAEKENTIIGTISLTSEGEIENLFVKPEYHNNGVGKKLLEEVEIKAKKKKLDKIFLYASITAKEFYENNGYVKEHDEVEEINGEEYKLHYMTKTLKSNNKKY